MSARRPVVIDMSLILTLSGAGALERFLWASRVDWHVTPIVRREATRHESRDVIDHAIAAGHLQVTEIDITDQGQMDEWAKWELVVDIGEAEAIALALARHWVVGLEDRQAQRALDREAGPGHWLNAVNLLLDAVADRVLPFADADSLFTALDSYPGYRKRGVGSLADLLTAPALSGRSSER
jgi:predicted nucleic acid-binding protein